MTALSEYQRLETTGLWREGPDRQRREVIVGFRDASLVLSDSRNDVPLSHWSLPAVRRVNPGEMPAIYAPGDDDGETLELTDETMIAAIEKVHRLIEARKPHPGRLRSILLGVGLVTVLGLGIFWLPGELVRHTASVVPFAKRSEIGKAILADVARISGAPCASGPGQRALASFSERLIGPVGGELVILPSALSGTRHLPGKIILMGRDLVEDHESPEVAAGYILAERLRAEASDPLEELLHWAGFGATFRLLTTGNLPGDSIAGYGEALLATQPGRVADEDLLAWFEAAGVPSSPYAYAVDISGESVLGLIEADPFRSAPPPAPLLSDGDWISLQGICGE
ncbi:hypothetical protein [Ostreiculturibacter nitratireducens]|uniref:hypothetical protein n=1 Tax=Ostreiculturibacter nitratireducens TaxID=3075226 RepID=UPI0031B57F26